LKKKPVEDIIYLKYKFGIFSAITETFGKKETICKD